VDPKSKLFEGFNIEHLIICHVKNEYAIIQKLINVDISLIILFYFLLIKCKLNQILIFNNRAAFL